jgi:hypothetical protein
VEFISAEEFLKQPKEVQEVFVDWWEPSIGDLATNRHSDLSILKENRDIEAVKIYKGKPYAIPLFTEGQLRKFIEDKTGYHLEMSSEFVTGFYTADFYTNNKSNRAGRMMIKTQETDLLKAYWKVALEIAKESDDLSIK